MMQTMRSSAKIIFFIILVAFVGFMVVSGVVTSLGGKRRAQGSNPAPPGVVGRVNGEDLSHNTFDEMYRQRLQSLSKDDHEPTEAEMDQARNDIWNNMTTIALMEQEARKHGISVTDRDVALYMRQSPPKDIRDSKELSTNGQFDLAKYQSWLQQLAGSSDPRAQAIITDFENQIRQQLMITRVQEFVLSQVKVTENDAKQDYIDKNDKVKVKYIFIPGGDFDSTITSVPESEIKARYDKDKEQLKQPEMAVLNYVQFPKTASQADAAEAKKAIDDIYAQLQGGADFAALATERSQDPGSAKNGGDLGWFGEGRMVAEFWNATKSLQKIGDISAPFQSQFGWHIIKLTGKRTTKDKDGKDQPEYQASHILILVEASPSTLAEVEQKANNFKIDAEKLGFKEAAQEYAVTLTESKPFPAGAMVPGIGQNQALNDFAFKGKIGELSDVTSGRNSFSVCQISKHTPAGYTPYTDAKDRLEKMILREKRVELAHKKGEELAAQIKSGKTLEDLSAQTGKPVLETDYFAHTGFIPKIGSDPDFTGAAFSLSASNPYSKCVNSRTGAYILQFVDRQPADVGAFTAMSDSLTNSMIDSKRKDYWGKWLNEIKQKAKIEDFRTSYYGS
jgi:peptidyl-prolyl cis-trans isomerase D